MIDWSTSYLFFSWAPRFTKWWAHCPVRRNFFSKSFVKDGSPPSSSPSPRRSHLMDNSDLRFSKCGLLREHLETHSCGALLVSTYVVCERLSVMRKQVSVQLTSNSKFLPKFSRTPLFWNLVLEYPPSPNLKFRQILALWVFDFRIPLPPIEI